MYLDKNREYFSNLRADLISLIPENEENKILEIGAGSCETLIDIDRLIIGNIENLELDLPKNYFDVIICGDIIEHLVEPEAALRKLYDHLKQDGIIIASIPNFRDYHILYRVAILADFKYTDRGILDRAHIRFFCKKNIISLLTSAEYVPVSIYSMFHFDKAQRTRKIINRLTFGLIRDLLTSQYIIVAKKAGFETNQ
jgi:SAM-dependent methyltransferase